MYGRGAFVGGFEEERAVLTAIHPLLTGGLLAHLDAMGYSDGVVLAGAPSSRSTMRRRSTS